MRTLHHQISNSLVMNNPVSQRFVKCHDKLKDNQQIRSSRQFAMSLDYLPQSLSEILKGRRDATIELLRKSIEVYRMNPVYLFTGKGAMFMQEVNSKDFRVLSVVKNEDGKEQIIHVPSQAQSGYAGDVTDDTFLKNLPSFTLPDYKYQVGVHRSFDVCGDNMEPTLFEGDKVVCSFIEPNLWKKTLKENYVYVIVTRGDVIIKRLANQVDENNEILLRSDNSFYEPYRISVNDIREIWYVRAKISPFLPSPQNTNNMMRDEVQEVKKILQEQTASIQNLIETFRKD